MTGRTFYAAAHVAAFSETEIDWEATLRFRHYLWSLGLGVAEAMDTAQRGMGLSWDATQQLIKLSAAEAGGPLACGVGTDNLATGRHSLHAIESAYAAQLEVVQAAGARVILMASRELAASARGTRDYHAVYDRLLCQVDRPVILHWLGEMFDPQLAGYWGPAPDESVLALIHAHSSKVDGIKVSLLDPDREIALRSQLPAGVKLYTGDDFHYPALIESGSHALLGIFDAIAVPASRALAAISTGDTAAVREILDPTVPLARHIFEPPTYHYKTGIVFLAWLNGFQDGFVMVGGQESARSHQHLRRLYELALDAGVIADPDLAAARWATL
jgi:Protein of unknown function (DUF993)